MKVQYTVQTIVAYRKKVCRESVLQWNYHETIKSSGASLEKKQWYAIIEAPTAGISKAELPKIIAQLFDKAGIE